MRSQFVGTACYSKDGSLATTPSRSNLLAWRPGAKGSGTVSITCHNKKALKFARTTCPWASTILPVTGGYQCFESVDDAQTWMRQK